ncbi:uncharacterized protein BKA55DRAFT_697477 [Fusarium redolens]|uniref:Uncharacterized protein n=1 Tax=Fusarium redolens TaxID=48865 RepID=A0A9P9JQV9_FUSRE|nr:uncharacterized protein BKA55DRAFT_697477 [Fusarium redolens]KAH7220425.1 hypothetical protein BKA55DRAFT_697477 [Fusarium redolens]
MYFSNVIVSALAAQALAQDNRVPRARVGQVAALIAAAAALPGSALPVFDALEARDGAKNKGAKAKAVKGCKTKRDDEEEEDVEGLVARHHEGANGKAAAKATNNCNKNGKRDEVAEEDTEDAEGLEARDVEEESEEDASELATRDVEKEDASELVARAKKAKKAKKSKKGKKGKKGKKSKKGAKKGKEAGKKAGSNANTGATNGAKTVTTA